MIGEMDGRGLVIWGIGSVFGRWGKGNGEWMKTVKKVKNKIHI